jgi:uncharacterized membrane protein
MNSLRRYFVAGLAALFPVAVTLLVVVKLFQFSEGWAHRLFGFTVPGLGLLITVSIILVVGFLSTHVIGRLIFPTLDTLLGRIPLIKSIYPAIKQLTQFLFQDGKGATMLRQVVLVEYPKSGIYSPAFVTNEIRAAALGGKTMLVLLIPTPPSPFSGPMIFVPKESVIPLAISVEEALKMVVSAGVISAPLNKTP